MQLTIEMAPAFGAGGNLTHEVEFARPDSVSVVALVNVAICAVRASTPSTGILAAAGQMEWLHVSRETLCVCTQGPHERWAHPPGMAGPGAGPIICMAGMPAAAAGPMAIAAILGAIAGVAARRLLLGSCAPAAITRCV